MTLMLTACTSSSAPACHPSTGLIVWISTPAPPDDFDHHDHDDARPGTAV
jgi:hypothetical protein